MRGACSRYRRPFTFVLNDSQRSESLREWRSPKHPRKTERTPPAVKRLTLLRSRMIPATRLRVEGGLRGCWATFRAGLGVIWGSQRRLKSLHTRPARRPLMFQHWFNHSVQLATTTRSNVSTIANVSFINRELCCVERTQNTWKVAPKLSEIIITRLGQSEAAR